MALLNFNTANEEEMDDFTAIPPADYNVQIVKSELKDTQSGDGKRLNFQFKVLDGKFKGRIIFTGLNLVNPNPTAVEISRKELTSICKACGKTEVEDSSELHNIPLTVSVKIKPAQGNYSEQNQITKYMPYSGVDGASASSSTKNDGKDAGAESGDDGKMPWESE